MAFTRARNPSIPPTRRAPPNQSENRCINQTVEPKPVYNSSQTNTTRRNTVATEKKTGIGERVLARLSSQMSDDVPIKLKKMDSAGNVVFTVSTDDLITPEEREEVAGQTPINRRLGTYFVDTIGELLVRRNLEEFLTFLVKIKSSDLDRLNRAKHMNFGLGEKKGELCFIFHVSLLQRIFVDMVNILVDESEEDD